ncbi:MAG: cation transporter [Rhodospirillaceae bacterium]
MSDCCENKSCAIEALRGRQRGTLIAVLWINAAMFVAILTAGMLAGSTAVLSDSLDNLGDALTYGLTLYAVSRGDRAKARIALIKGLLILGAGLFVASQLIYKLAHPVIPLYGTMTFASMAGLVANGICLALLWKHRCDDVNMSSVWECSRNDIASNVSVLLAAGGVWLTGSAWPDLVVGALLALLFLRSATRVVRNASAVLAAQPARQA